MAWFDQASEPTYTDGGALMATLRRLLGGKPDDTPQPASPGPAQSPASIPAQMPQAPQMPQQPVGAPGMANAQMPQQMPAQQSPQMMPPQAPQQSAELSFGDRLLAGLQSSSREGSIVHNLANGIQAFQTGQRNDPQAVAQQTARQTYAALEPLVGRQKALLGAVSPEYAKLLVAEAGKSNFINVGGGKIFDSKSQQFIRDPDAETGGKWGVVGEDQYGNKKYGYPPARGEASATETPVAGRPSAGNGLSGDDYLATLPSDKAAQVKAMSEGRMLMPSGQALRTAWGKEMMDHLSAYDPAFDESNARGRVAVRKDFTSGKSSKNLTSFNTTLQHLESLDTAIDGLHNTDYPTYNSLSGWLADKAGNTKYQVARGNFETARQAATAELTTAFRGSSGNVADIEDWNKKIDLAKSPAELHAIVKNAVELLRGRIEAVGDTYNRGMGTTHDPLQLLSPKAQQAYQKLGGGHYGASDSANTSKTGIKWSVE